MPARQPEMGNWHPAARHLASLPGTDLNVGTSQTVTNQKLSMLLLQARMREIDYSGHPARRSGCPECGGCGSRSSHAARTGEKGADETMSGNHLTCR
jgi:hypothetical protein